jgi:TetR/AcrR family transcriptional regulator, repressor for uid operon
MPLTSRERTWRDTHERLYEAAIRQIERVGFSDVRIEKICEETNLSRPTFYAHFSNKDGVVSELLHRFMDGIARGLEARVQAPHRLETVVDELVKLCHSANSTTSERLRRELAAYLPRHHDIDLFSTSPVFTILTRAIVQAAQRREIRPVADARAVARQITVVINGFFLAHPNDPAKAARESREVLELMLQGLRTG